ncbi:winged helix domain-containing protein [Microvirga lotononidis]|uniref:Winged helix domain-containing protein n=1 Tax=Microvirga lotononidis TaxID=864069 RepID=I4YRR8_9HYPH|nr:hypothetical protein [Microvirga lotononidis]EIM26660.1 hypothetical protein MicloDRAFT_00032090 [Microvirga lotononidis]WQO32106.1 hypothetical protein U0023_35250 [Microvirga lotononidis]
MSRSMPTVSLDVQVGERTLSFKGRVAWALQNLIDRGERGVTPIDTPGPRWSHYIFVLRGFGLTIETINESHGGPFSGTHARYVLRTPVTVLKDKRFGEAA